MSDETQIPPFTRRVYRGPILLASGGLVASAIATGAMPIYATLITDPAPGDPGWFPLVGALIGGGFWGVIAVALFLWAWKKAKLILQQPQESFSYTKWVSGLLVAGGVFVLGRNVWWVVTAPAEIWPTMNGAVGMMIVSSQALTAAWCLWTSWLRVTGSGFGGPATIAALVFLAHAYWPLAVVTFVVYLFVRKNEGSVRERV